MHIDCVFILYIKRTKWNCPRRDLLNLWSWWWSRIVELLNINYLAIRDTSGFIIKKKNVSKWLLPMTTALLRNQGLYSQSGKTSYRKISWSLDAERFGFYLSSRSEIDSHIDSHIVAEMSVKFQSNTTIITSNLAALRLQRFGGKTSYRLVNRGPELIYVFKLRIILPYTIIQYLI